MRKIIQIAFFESTIFALCDDETIWSEYYNTLSKRNEWKLYEIEPIPQPAPSSEELKSITERYANKMY